MRPKQSAFAAYSRNSLASCGFAEAERGKFLPRESMKTSCLPLRPQECCAAGMSALAALAIFLILGGFWLSWLRFVAERRQAFCQTARETVGFLAVSVFEWGRSDGAGQYWL